MTYYTSLNILKLLTKEQMQRWLIQNQGPFSVDYALTVGLADEVIETENPEDGQVLGFGVSLTEEMIPWENEEGETGESLHLKFKTTWADEASVQADKRAFFESQHYTEDEILAAL